MVLDAEMDMLDNISIDIIDRLLAALAKASHISMTCRFENTYY
jgi:hypothetical protein